MALEAAEITVVVPRLLMSVTGDSRRLRVPVTGSVTLAALLDMLADPYPIFDHRVRDETGALRRYVNLYLDGENVRTLGGLAARITPGQEVQIIQSVAGG